jgi:hypothetical protein
VFTVVLPYVRVFPDMSSFSGFRIVSRGDFSMLRKCPGFWPLSIATFSFWMVVTYVIVRSSRRPRFNFRAYFHSHFRLFRTHACTALFRTFILNCMQ